MRRGGVVSKEKNVVGKKKEEQRRGEQWHGRENKDVMKEKKKKSIGGLDVVYGMAFQSVHPSVSQSAGREQKKVVVEACTHAHIFSLSFSLPTTAINKGEGGRRRGRIGIVRLVGASARL